MLFIYKIIYQGMARFHIKGKGINSENLTRKKTFFKKIRLMI